MSLVSGVCAGQHIQNINWLMAFLILCWFVITIIYIVVRATKSLHLGKATAYGVWVLIMEVSLHICLQNHPTHFGCSNGGLGACHGRKPAYLASSAFQHTSVAQLTR